MERLPVRATLPTSGVIVTPAALRASHCNVVDPPRSIVAGCARNVIVGVGVGGAGGGVAAAGGGGATDFLQAATIVNAASNTNAKPFICERVISEISLLGKSGPCRARVFPCVCQLSYFGAIKNH